MDSRVWMNEQVEVCGQEWENEIIASAVRIIGTLQSTR